jgi:hypothetical protein
MTASSQTDETSVSDSWARWRRGVHMDEANEHLERLVSIVINYSRKVLVLRPELRPSVMRGARLLLTELEAKHADHQEVARLRAYIRVTEDPNIAIRKFKERRGRGGTIGCG